MLVRKIGLTNNQLKLIAMLTMTFDHVGLILFPGVIFLRLIGRLAFPIFAYMVAEGCHYTRSLPKYLAGIAAIALLCQGVSFFVAGSLEQCILVTFSLSVALIILLKNAFAKKNVQSWCFFALATGAVFAITQLLPQWLPGNDFAVDYGFLGVMLPVGIYAAGNKKAKLAVCALVLSGMASYMWPGQWVALLAIPLLALYNGQRGKWKIKWLFYAYYPLHLAIIWVISFLF